MNKRMFAIVVMIAAGSFGCMKQQCPKIPETACGQCAMQIGAKTKDTAITAAELTSKGMTTVVEFLKKSEKYLSEKVEEWKKTNPELVAEGQASLSALRAKIAEYETKVRLTLKEAL